jgi:UDP:flavonoid glycosyltransferase YjiC (YdhE family)
VRLAVFVSAHGFGHAARAAALLAALRAREPRLEPTLFTTVPRWFFAESLDFEPGRREEAVDVGFVQRGPLEEDLPATLERLERFWREADGGRTSELADALRSLGAAAVLCDVSPLGLLAARAAGLPSILVENFTWDWIYEGTLDREPRFAPWIARLRGIFDLATLRIQAEPACDPVASAVAVPPIARRPRTPPAAVRARLGVEPGRTLVLVSLGGIEARPAGAERLRLDGTVFVVPGGVGAGEPARRHGDAILLPHRTPIHHPDLVHAADAVVGKLGYSTVAEALAAGTRYAWVPRPGFRESAVLARHVGARLPSLELDPEEFASGAWTARLPALLARPRPAPAAGDGAVAAARAILEARILQRS